MFREIRVKGGIFLLLLAVIVLTVSVGCENTQEDSEESSLAGYFPASQGLVYQFRGTGNEFASFTREIKYVKGPYIQLHDDNGGTVTALVYHRDEERLGKVVSRPEYYSSESLIEELSSSPENGTALEDEIIKTPLKEGNTWESGNRRREIVETGQVVTVPAGVFYDVLKIKEVAETEQGSFTSYDYFAENIGLIKRVSVGENYQIISELESYVLPPDGQTAGGTENEASRQDINPGLLAYQLERQLRADFQGAYESYINMERLSGKAEADFEQIISRLQASLSGIASPEVVNRQLDNLRRIYQGREGEKTFPTHEVVKEVETGPSAGGGVDVNLKVTRYYPAREWSGAAYKRTVDYTVSLEKKGGSWIIGSIGEITSPGPTG